MKHQILVKRILLSVLFCLFTAMFAQAASVADIQQRISSLRQSVQEAEQELQALKDELAEIQRQEPAIKQEYDNVSEELDIAFEKANSEDEEAHKDAMVVSFKFNRIDRKHTRFIERKKEVEDSVAGMEQKVTEWQAELSAAEKALVEKKAAALKAEQQAAELAKRQQAERVAAETKAQQLKGQQEAAALSAAAIEKSKAAERAARVEAAGWPDSKAPKPEQITFAKKELARLQALPASNPPFNKVELEPSCGSDTPLKYQGENIYTAVVSLDSGMCKVEIFRSDYWVELAAQGRADYRVIYDVSSISAPKLFVFEERLLR